MIIGTHIKQRLSVLALLISLISSCEKVDIAFNDTGINDNPDLVEIDNLEVALGTIKQDSLLTSGSVNLFVGQYWDAYAGKTASTTFAEVQYPATNTLLNKAVRFDSICLILKPTGTYKGDTTLPFSIAVHELLENIKNANATDAYYNSRSFAYSSATLASASAIIKPSLKKEWSIRLPDALGQAWVQKLVSNATEIQSQESFRNFFKGLAIVPQSSNNSMLYFTGDSTTLIRIYYKETGLINEPKQLDFLYANDRTFFHYDYDYSGTYFANINPLKRQYFTSAETGNTVLYSSLVPSSIKFSFPNILQLKERFPDVKIVKAVLEIKPKQGSYFYPAALPAQININETGSSNTIGTYLYDADGETIQDGNLEFDPLNLHNTKYSFNITSFINSLIAEGQFSTKALMLSNANSSLSETAQLILNDQTIQTDVKLKVYVLAL